MRVSTILRLHTVEMIDRLELALMSLCGQRHQALEPIIVLQRFSIEDACKVEEMAREFPWAADVIGPRVLNITDIPEGDQRAELLNRGIAAATGEFIGFLDYDDYLYPNAYSKLLTRFTPTIVAVMGGVVISDVDPDRPGGYVIGKRRFPTAQEKMRFFHENIYPIHSMLIRSDQLKAVRIPSKFTVLEDYYLLLNILSRGDWDSSLVDESICEYVYWVNGSNTVDLGGFGEAKSSKWNQARDEIQRWRDANYVRVGVAEIAKLASSAGTEAGLEVALLRAIRNSASVLAFPRKADAALIVNPSQKTSMVKLKLQLSMRKKQPIGVVLYSMQKRLFRLPKMRFLCHGYLAPSSDLTDTYECTLQLQVSHLCNGQSTDAVVAFAIGQGGKFTKLRLPPTKIGDILNATDQSIL